MTWRAGLATVRGYWFMAVVKNVATISTAKKQSTTTSVNVSGFWISVSNAKARGIITSTYLDVIGGGRNVCACVCTCAWMGVPGVHNRGVER